MSLWGATVITNLLSAIPIFGQDIVELIFHFVRELLSIPSPLFPCAVIPASIRRTGIWQGRYKRQGQLLLLPSPRVSPAPVSQPYLYLDKNKEGVACAEKRGRQRLRALCGGYNDDLNFKKTVITVLPTIGTVSTQALKKGKQLRLDKNEYLSIPYQFISFLVGLIDGDGYIQITPTTKGFITIKLVIGLGLDDLSTLEYIHSVLKLGKITIYRDYRNPICKLIINKTDLQEIVFPLLIHHNIFFLTNTRRDQFDLAIHIFKNNLKSFENIPNIINIPSIFIFPETASVYLNLDFFRN